MRVSKSERMCYDLVYAARGLIGDDSVGWISAYLRMAEEEIAERQLIDESVSLA